MATADERTRNKDATASEGFVDYGPLSLTTDNLKLVRSIGHQIEKDPLAKRAPMYSVLLSNHLQKMSDKLAATIRSRIVRAFAKNSRKVAIRFVKVGPGTVFDTARKMLAADNDADFIQLSQDLAEDLAEAHRNGAPGGLMFVSQASIDGRKALIIIKADKQDGVGAAKKAGERTYAHIDELFLSSGSVVHKVVILVKRDTGDGPSSFQALLYDGSLRKKEDFQASRYFIMDFLAADIAREGRRETYTFYMELTKAINAMNAAPEEKLELMRERDAFMNGPASAFSLSQYVDDHVAPAHQEELEELMRVAGVHDEVIIKDTQDLTRTLKTSDFKLDNGVIVKVPIGTAEADFSVRTVDGQVVIQTTARNITVLK